MVYHDTLLTTRKFIKRYALAEQNAIVICCDAIVICCVTIYVEVNVKENECKLRTVYWLQKLLKKTYKARCITHSISFTITHTFKFVNKLSHYYIKHNVVKSCYLRFVFV